MNRALGFGIAAAGALPTLVVNPSPASAHQVTQTSPDGTAYVHSVGSTHDYLFVSDHSGDTIYTKADYKTRGGIVDYVLPPLGGWGVSPTFPEAQEITAFRKCHRDGPGGDWGCNNWVNT